MQDETRLRLEEMERAAAHKADLERWERVERQKIVERLAEEEKIRQWVPERADFLYKSEVSRRNGSSLVPPELRETRIDSQKQHDEAQDRAWKQANLDYTNYCNRKTELAKDEFLQAQDLARKQARDAEELERQQKLQENMQREPQRRDYSDLDATAERVRALQRHIEEQQREMERRHEMSRTLNR